MIEKEKLVTRHDIRRQEFGSFDAAALGALRDINIPPAKRRKLVICQRIACIDP